jgi:hypothetical protein
MNHTGSYAKRCRILEAVPRRCTSYCMQAPIRLAVGNRPGGFGDLVAEGNASTSKAKLIIRGEYSIDPALFLLAHW